MLSPISRRKPFSSWVLPLLLAILTAGALPAQAQTAPDLQGSGWVNAEELDLQRFRGKIVVLYFFEET